MFPKDSIRTERLISAGAKTPGEYGIPRTDSACHLLRQRLLEKFQHYLSSCKVFIFEAQPGQGKTVAAAQCLESTDSTSLWLRLNDRDATPSQLAEQLTALLKQQFPQLETRLSGELATSPLSPKALQDCTQQLLRTLATELGEQTLFVVLDEIERVAEHVDTLAFIADLTRQAPPSLKIVLSGRTIPAVIGSQLPVESTLWIRNAELAFTADEIRQLYQDTLQLAYPRRLAQTLYRLTRGWITGIVHLLEGLRSASPQQPDPKHNSWPPLQIAHEGISAFFQKHVFDRLPQEEQRLLAALAWLDPVSPSLTKAALGTAEPDKRLKELAGKNLFFHSLPTSGQHFEFHPLFRTFLLEQSHQVLDSATHLATLTKAAETARLQGNSSLAVRYALRGGALELADRLIAADKSLFINPLDHFEEDVCADDWTPSLAHPWLALLQTAAVLEHDPLKARPLLLQLIDKFVARGDDMGELCASSLLILGHSMTDGCRSTMRPLRARINEIVARQIEPLEATVNLMVGLAIGSAFLYDDACMRESHTHAYRALEYAQQTGAVNHEAKLRVIRGFAYLFLGELSNAAVEVEHLQRHLQNPALTDLNRLLIRGTSCFLISCYGDHEGFCVMPPSLSDTAITRNLNARLSAP
ncbi:AAA family ATPase [Alkalilimnicola ehrlichii]|uniref:AAA family ATPase n=1 Tax=Alkalilimnicola ehrlichii TaxID=351052 RepID=UPI0011C07C27|nr:AAA family ATPase [Alkalilimnicola ehrlichii]